MPQAKIDDTLISYTDTGGDGRAVLLVHAFPLDSKMWAGQIDAFGDRYRLIAPDLKGFGGSDAPEEPAAYSMDDYADCLAGLLDELGLDQVVLVGLSIGGYISFAFLRRHPGRLAGLVLADTRAEADPPEGVAKRTSQQELVASEGTGVLIPALAGALLSERTRSDKPEVVANATTLMDNPVAGFIGALEAMKLRGDSSADLASIDVPTLVIVGEDDAVTPPEAARKLHEHIGGSRLVVIPGAGHLSNLEAPEAFNDALGGFLATLG